MKEKDPIANAVTAATKSHPPLMQAATQDQAVLEPFNSGHCGVIVTTSQEPVWYVEERQLSGDWLAIDQADDQEDAEAKLSHAENCLPGTFRIQRSDW